MESGIFGEKPDIIIKGGMIIASKMGDANASIPITQPVMYQPMFAAHGKAKMKPALPLFPRLHMMPELKIFMVWKNCGSCKGMQKYCQKGYGVQ